LVFLRILKKKPSDNAANFQHPNSSKGSFVVTKRDFVQTHALSLLGSENLRYASLSGFSARNKVLGLNTDQPAVTLSLLW